MNKFNKIFVCLLAFSSVFAISDNDIFAQKKSQSKKNKNKGKNKKSKSKISSALSGIDTTARADRTDTSSIVEETATAPAVVVDEDTEASILSENLKACITPICDGDVPYEKCFKRGATDTAMRQDITCKSMYDNASSDIVRLKAMNNLNASIKNYFSDACEGAGGKVSGDTCKVNICYFAKGGSEDKEPKKRCQDFKVGQSFTCSYASFGYSEQDMEYQEKMTSEQMAQVIQAGMGMVQGALTTTMSVVDAVSASKELKTKNIIKGKECTGTFSYKTGSISITEKTDCKQVYYLCSDKNCTSVNEECNDKTKCKTGTTDSYGNKYCVCKEEGNPKNNTLEDCATNTEEVGDTFKCTVTLSEYTEMSKAEKEAELYKKFTDFDTLKLMDQYNAYGRQRFLSGGMTNNSTSYNDKYDYFHVTADARDDTECKVEATTRGNLLTNTCKIEGNVEDECKYAWGNQKDECIKQLKNNNQKRYSFKCKCERKNTSSGKKNPMEFEYEENKDCDYEYVIDQNSGYPTSSTKKCKSFQEQAKEHFSGIQETLKGFKTNNYSSAVSTYNSKMKSVNEKKEEIASLKERKSTGIANAIGTAASTLTQQGTALTTTLISASQNKGIRTGNCYIGDPQNGGTLFAPENSRKTLSWKNL